MNFLLSDFKVMILTALCKALVILLKLSEHGNVGLEWDSRVMGSPARVHLISNHVK